MNYLGLVQRLAREAGMSTLNIQSIENASGKVLHLADLVADAWAEIQQDRAWSFMRKLGQIPITAGVRAYPLAAVVSDVKEWCKTADGQACLRLDNPDGSFGRVMFLERQRFIDRFEREAFQTRTPGYFNMEEGYTLGLDAFPLIDGTLRGYYWKTASRLVNDDDEPNMSEDWHLGIVWSALRSYGEYNEAPEMVARGRRKFSLVNSDMCAAELPDVTFAANPLGWGDTWR